MSQISSLIRQATHRVFQGTSYWRRLPVGFDRAPLKVSPEAALKYLKPTHAAFTQDLLDIADRYVHAGDCVWDVGANVGLFSVLAAVRAGAAGQVVAFEPDPFLLHLLQQTAMANAKRGLNVEIVPLAVSDDVGLARFNVSSNGRAMNFLQQHGRSARTIRFSRIVATTTLDTMLGAFPPPRVLKIDIEGAEVAALRGAKRLLSDVRPIIYVEVGSEQSAVASEILLSAGYHLHAYDDGNIFPCQSCPFRTVALPKEHV